MTTVKKKKKSKIWSYEKNDPNFKQDLENSHKHVQIVAGWLKESGLDVEVQPLKIREKIEEMSKFSDDGDLYCGKNRLEVKQRRIDFDSKESFPYDTFIIDVAHAWKKAKEKPFAYIVTNKATTSAFVVFGDSVEHWKEEERWDRFKKRKRKFMEVSMEHVYPFVDLVNRLKENKDVS